MTKKTMREQIMELAVHGIPNAEIQRRVGCAASYVYTARTRSTFSGREAHRNYMRDYMRKRYLARKAEQCRAHPTADPRSKQERILRLLDAGLPDAMVARQVECSREYVRAVRFRANSQARQTDRAAPMRGGSMRHSEF